MNRMVDMAAAQKGDFAGTTRKSSPGLGAWTPRPNEPQRRCHEDKLAGGISFGFGILDTRSSLVRGVVQQAVDGARTHHRRAAAEPESGPALYHQFRSEFADCFCVGADLHLAQGRFGGAGRGCGSARVDRGSRAGDLHHVHVLNSAQGTFRYQFVLSARWVVPDGGDPRGVEEKGPLTVI